MPRLLSIISLAMLLVLTACKHKSDEPSVKIPSDATYDFVTVSASHSHGCILTLRKADDSPLIEYISTYDLASSSTHVSVGDRLIICYKPLDGPVYSSGRITLYGYATLDNTEQLLQIIDSQMPASWVDRHIRVMSLWRTGEYINLQGEIFVAVAQKPKEFVLTLERESLYEPVPRLYMSYVNQDGNNGENPYGTNASFDIGLVWDLPTCQGVEVCVPTSSGLSTYTFLKSQEQ